MKTNILFAIILVLFISSCSNEKATKPIIQKQSENYIILIDLSDRLLNEGQVEQDLELICSLFEKFESTVRNNLIINSHDNFRIVIAPQEKMAVNRSQYEGLFYLDMSKIDIAEKRTKLEQFKENLKSNLSNLYSEAILNKTKSSDFQGADIWKYFNDFLSGDLKSGNKNQLFILSDGYFDFEASSVKKSVEGKSTSSTFLKSVRGKTNWKELIEKNNYGIIPVEKQFESLSVCLMEVYPKYKNLDETDMLQFVWSKWLVEMNIENFGFIPHASIPKMKGQIDNYLNL